MGTVQRHQAGNPCDLLPTAGRVAPLEVMDNVEQRGDPVLVGCQAGLHALQPLLQAR